MTTRDIDIMLQRQQAMQRAKLKQNEHKGGWRGDDLALLLFRLYEEADELKAEVSRLMDLQRQGAKALLPKQALVVMHEAADVANFAGFVIDKLWSPEALWDGEPTHAQQVGVSGCPECGGTLMSGHHPECPRHRRNGAEMPSAPPTPQKDDK